LNSETLLGKWYALDANRYYQIVGKPISYYKMYVNRVENDKIYYDSFIQFEDGSIEALKVDREASLVQFNAEIQMGYLIRSKSTMRLSLNDIGRKYGLNIAMQLS
jgi:hypothetical protein